jgi:hypothetical protein
MIDDDEVMAGFQQKTEAEKKIFVNGIKSEIKSKGRSPISVELLSSNELNEFIFDEVGFKNPSREAELRRLAKARGIRMTAQLRS